MGRPKERTDLLMPLYATRLRQWGLTRRSAKTLLDLGDMPDASFWRILRSDEATPTEVRTVAHAIKHYGREHNLPGWKDLD